MAGFSDKIRILLDVDSNGAVKSLKNFRTEVAAADGPIGKFKAAGTGAMDAIKANAGALAVAGGAAVAAFAAKGIADFQNLGVEIGKFSDATGTTVEDASRLIEVAGDLGVEQSALEAAIGRMNKTAGASPELFAALGAEIVRTDEGLVDTNETFLAAVDRLNAIEDPAKKAEAGAKLFGKGWQEMAELIGQGAPQLRQDLAAVSDAKVFDQGKVDDARALRGAFDEIVDAGQDLLLTIGSALAPAISELAPIVADVVEEAGPLVEVMGKGLAAALKIVGPLIEGLLVIIGPVVDAFVKLQEGIVSVLESVKLVDAPLDNVGAAMVDMMNDAKALRDAEDDVTTATGEMGDAAVIGGGHLAELEAKADEAEQATKDLEDAYKELTGTLSDREAWLGVEDEIDAYKTKIDDAKTSNREKEQAMIDLKQKMIDYLTSLENIPEEQQTNVLALIDQGRFDEAEAALAWLGRQRSVSYSAVTGGQLPDVDRFDSGGVMGGPKGVHSLALVAGGETILPTHKQPLSDFIGGAGGNTINVTIQTGADPRAVVEAIKQYERLNGAGWRS